MSGFFEVFLRKELRYKVVYLIVCRNFILLLILSGILLRICLSVRVFSFRFWNFGFGRLIIYFDKINIYKKY